MVEKNKGQLNLGTINASQRQWQWQSWGAGSLSADTVINSGKEEAGMGKSFAAGRKSLYNYIFWLTPLRAEMCQGNFRPFVEHTLGGDKDFHSTQVQEQLKVCSFAAELANLKTTYLCLYMNGCLYF